MLYKAFNALYQIYKAFNALYQGLKGNQIQKSYEQFVEQLLLIRFILLSQKASHDLYINITSLHTLLINTDRTYEH